MEIARIISERRKELNNSFVSGTIDFWTDSHRKQSFGTFVIDVVAEKYELRNGMCLFMSRQTKVSLSNRQKSPLLTGKPILANSELVLNFEHFVKAKTCDIIANWMKESCDEVKMEYSDFS